MNQVDSHDLSLDRPGADLSLGLRLQRARQGAGLSVAMVAEQLRLKNTIIEAMEREDFAALGASVFARGYLVSYARLLDLPSVLVDSALARCAEPLPQLHSSAHVPHSRYLFDRYAKRAVYLVLTASIVVPVILLATRDQLPRPGARLAPLDVPPTEAAQPDRRSDFAAAPEWSVDEVGVDSYGPPAPPPALRSAAEHPVVASLAPFYNPPSEPGSSTPSSSGGAGLSLIFSHDSWVEVLGRNGERLEYGLMRGGTQREFALGSVARVALGNAEGVEVRVNGNRTDIEPFRRAKVARFTVSSDGSLAPAGG